MGNPRLLTDIQSQPASLQAVLSHQTGAGSAAVLEAGRLIRKAGRVIITGMGASLFGSIPLEYLLCEQGIDASVLESGEMLHYRRGMYRDTVIIMVSRSGESVEIAKLLAQVGDGATVIGVSNDPASMLAQGADCSIHIGSLPDEMVAIQSYTGTLLALGLLGAAVTGEFEYLVAQAEEVIGRLGGYIEGLLASGDWNEFLSLSAPVHLLARGPSYGSALEGALLFNETAKYPACGIAAASFRHGPVEMVDGNFVGFVFAPAGQTRELNVSLASDLAYFGGRVCVVGPGPRTGGPRWCETIPVTAPLAPLVEIIPVQVAALRLAQMRGLKVGEFRYTPQVTRDEARFSRPHEPVTAQ
ncbi:MAG: SIS domain-containing protein [Bryobacteraceae bacterium]|nr:SIS domain-containing protein [Bryobacteraceae bacterium]